MAAKKDTRFKKGNPGGPGAPPGPRLPACIKRILSETAPTPAIEKLREVWGDKVDKYTNMEVLARVAMLQAMNGDKAAREWLTDRAFGKQKPIEELPPDDGAPDELTDAALRAQLAEGQRMIEDIHKQQEESGGV